MKKILLISSLLMVIATNVNAVVTTYDTATVARQTSDKAEAVATMANYSTQLTSTFNKMSDAKDAVAQLKNLKGLQKLQGAENLCNLCSATDAKKLSDYSSSINDDLCAQFGFAYKNLTGITKTFNSLQDIAKMLTTDPRSAALALQQASVSAAQTTNSTLAQMQVMQAQMIQKQLADEKTMQNNAKAMANTLKGSPF